MDIRSGIQLPTTRWKLPECNPDYREILTRELAIHPVISQILVNRSILDLDEAGKYL